MFLKKTMNIAVVKILRIVHCIVINNRRRRPPYDFCGDYSQRKSTKRGGNPELLKS